MSIKILVIDDSKTARMIVIRCIQMVLKDLKHEVIEANDGEDALLKMKDGSVDLIISDVNMPVMTGFTFLRNLKASEILSGIPVVFLTSLANDARIENLISIGAYDVIKKPVNPGALLNIFSKLNMIPDKEGDEKNNSWGGQ